MMIYYNKVIHSIIKILAFIKKYILPNSSQIQNRFLELKDMITKQL